MQECVVEETRKKLYFLFNNRAYPSNDAVLQSLIAKRNELAFLLGHNDFAHFDLADQMVQDVTRLNEFLSNIII